MSSIGGIARFDGEAACRSQLHSMAEALRHGGIDRQSAALQGSCGLFHNLFRATPEDAFEQQPLSRGNLALVADLRLDNRDDLLRDLGCEPDGAKSTPDSQLLFRAFEKWGHDSPSKLIGEFAFAIWNRSEGELFLARDQRGCRPLFYTRQGDRFAFASLPTALFRLPGVPRELNLQKLAAFLVLNHHDHESTHFVGIHRLPPGTSMRVSRGQTTQQRYWQLDPHRRLTLASSDEYVEQAKELLTQCVRSTLRSATPIGAFMSGGLDSSTVACVAARELAKSGQRLATFTEAPPLDYPHRGTDSRYFDETPYIKAIAQLLPNIDATILRPERLEFLAPDSSRHENLCSPGRNPLNRLWMEEIARSASERGRRILLSGQSGNMSLSYDGLALLAHWARTRKLAPLARALCALPRHSRFSALSLLKSKVLAPLLSPAGPWGPLARARIKIRGPAWGSYSALNPSFARREDIAPLLSASPFRPQGDGRSDRVALLDGFDYVGELSQNYARCAGVEVRDPLGDIRMLEFCLAIPEEEFLGPGRSRWLVRRAMKGTLPEATLSNRRLGSQLANWHDHLSRARARLQDEVLALRASPVASEVLDLERMQGLLDRWPDNGWHQSATTRNYRFLLARGVETGNFIRWCESLFVTDVEVEPTHRP